MEEQYGHVAMPASRISVSDDSIEVTQRNTDISTDSDRPISHTKLIGIPIRFGEDLQAIEKFAEKREKAALAKTISNGDRTEQGRHALHDTSRSPRGARRVSFANDENNVNTRRRPIPVNIETNYEATPFTEVNNPSPSTQVLEMELSMLQEGEFAQNVMAETPFITTAEMRSPNWIRSKGNRPEGIPRDS